MLAWFRVAFSLGNNDPRNHTKTFRVDSWIVLLGMGSLPILTP